jgi:hypothetical protein
MHQNRAAHCRGDRHEVPLSDARRKGLDLGIHIEATFKAKIALATVRGDKTLVELAQRHDVRSNQITDWKSQLVSKAADVFGGQQRPDEPTVDR